LKCVYFYLKKDGCTQNIFTKAINQVGLNKKDHEKKHWRLGTS